ncbi:capsule assembly Wzi family protein [Granulicella sibirica]|nr:capsule assembly Wzi family protein [Granulicella sibirica]
MLLEAESASRTRSDDAGIDATLAALRREFSRELEGSSRPGRLEALSTRSTSIGGEPLNDGYHFASTIVNDDGRPFARGENSYTNVAASSTFSHFAAYARIELQSTSSPTPQPSAAAQLQISAADFTPAAIQGPVTGFTRGRLPEAYLSFAIAGNTIAFGRQTLLWGPGRNGGSLFTNNADPVLMLRYDREKPFVLPGVLRFLGPIRAQAFIGRLNGTQFVHTNHQTFGSPGVSVPDQPFIHGEKVAFQPTPNWEFSVARTTLFAGQGAPFTTRTLLRSLFSTGTGEENADPGDRRVSFDTRYRVPGLQNVLTVYLDSFAEDEPFPLNYPKQSVWLPGLELHPFPHNSHWTLRIEGLLSPHRSNAFSGFFYFNVHYLSGYTNSRQLLGSWIGREAHGTQTWLTWHPSPRTFVEMSVRSQNVASDFLRGGTLRDLQWNFEKAVRPDLTLRLQEQVERWNFPLLSSTTHFNSSFTVQLTYRTSGGSR